MAMVKEEFLQREHDAAMLEFEIQAQKELDLDRDVLELMRQIQREKEGF